MKLYFKKQISLPASIKAIEEQKKVRIIRFKGPLDTTTLNEVDQFREKFRRHKDFKFKHLLLDFENVTRIDSSTVAEVITVMSDIRNSHHKMGIVNLSQKFQNWFEILKADKLVPFYGTELGAIRDLEV
jgi:anti-anti-sigma factor